MATTHGTEGGPRSYNDFVAANGLDPSGNHWHAFGEELDTYRSETAAKIGVSLDELHMMGDTAIQAALAMAEERVEELSLSA